jgi:hypothetical protein
MITIDVSIQRHNRRAYHSQRVFKTIAVEAKVLLTTE